MRRSLAAAILGISCWIGSLAWTAFVMTNTVLDPGRSRDVADALYEDEAVRGALADNLADALGAAVPEGIDVPEEVLQRAARTALDSPAVETLVVDAFVASHQAFLGAGDAPEAIEAGAMGEATRAALVEARPELDGVLPPAPSLRVPLPTERIPNLGPVRDVLAAAVPLLGGLSVAGILLALGVTRNRPALLRRAGIWAIGLSLAVLAFAYGLPALAERFTPGQAEVVGALIGALAASTSGPALGLAAVGAAGIATSFLWRAVPAAAGAALGGDPAEQATARAPRPGRQVRRDLPRPARRAPVAGAPSAATGVPRAGDPTVVRPPDPDGFARRPRPPVADPTGGYPSDPTRVESTPTAPTGSRRDVPVHGGDAAPGRHWVDGIGWVLDPAAPIPAHARWVPGVGYVVDR